MNQCKTLPWNQLEATRAPPHPLTIDHSDGYTLGGSQIVGGSLPSRGIARDSKIEGFPSFSQALCQRGLMCRLV